MPIWLIWIGKRVGHWIVYLIMSAIVGWIVYAGLIRPTTKPTPTTKQEAESIVNYNYSPRVSFGCAFWKMQRRPNGNKNITNTTPSLP